MSRLQRAFSGWLFRAGLLLFVFGSGPLLVIIAASKIRLTSDPNPNPVAFGMLAMLTFWPSLAMVAISLWKVARSDNSNAV